MLTWNGNAKKRGETLYKDLARAKEISVRGRQ